MPSTHPKYDSQHFANNDGSLDLCIYKTEATVLPSVSFYVVRQCKTVVATDATGDRVFKVTEGPFTNLVIKLSPGILPVGICELQVQLDFHDGTKDYRTFTVEVPKSKFHVPAPFDTYSTEYLY